MVIRKFAGGTALGAAALLLSINGIAAETDTIQLIPADQLLGKNIVAADGEDAGEIEYLLIDAGSTKVRYAVISEGGELELEDAEFVAVPFSDLRFTENEDDDFTVRASLSQLLGARRVTEDSLHELTDPLVITELYDYYATPEQDRIQSDQNHNQNQNQPQNRDQGNQDQPQNQNLNQDRARATTQDPGAAQNQSQNQSQDRNQRDQSVVQTNTSDQPGIQNQRNQDLQRTEPSEPASNNGEGDMNRASPHVLVAREFISTLIPGMRNTDEIVGSKVMTQTDDDFGEIEQLMLDVDEGRIAFAVVESGGILGVGSDHYPIPMQRMTWAPAEEAYRVDYVDVADIAGLTGIGDADDPASVSKAQLDRFYQAYGLNGYAMTNNWSSGQNANDTDQLDDLRNQ